MELLELLEDERRIAARPSRTRRRKSKFAASTKLQRQGASVDTPQEDSSVLQGASSAASDAAMPTAQELCGAELNGDTALPDATNTSDVCSMGGAISSASWDLGSGIDDGGVSISLPLRLAPSHLAGQHVEHLLAGALAEVVYPHWSPPSLKNLTCTTLCFPVSCFSSWTAELG